MSPQAPYAIEILDAALDLVECLNDESGPLGRRLPTPAPTATPTNTPTPTSTPASAGFPASVILDTFNRANGTIGSSWSGLTSYSTIANNLLSFSNEAYIFWNAATFGASQEVYVTLTSIDTSAPEIDLLLKSQRSNTYAYGVLEVWYDPVNQRVQVWTYSSAQGWVKHGVDIQGSNISVRNIRTQYQGVRGIVAWYGNNVTIEDNEVFRTARFGIEVYGTQSTLIRNNKVWEIGGVFDYQFGFDQQLIGAQSVEQAGLTARRSHNLNLAVHRLSTALGAPLPSFSTGLLEFYTQYHQGYPQLVRSYQQATIETDPGGKHERQLRPGGGE